MKYTKTILLCLLIFSFRPGLNGQTYFRHYQVEDGLSNNAVICSVQDKNGFLWFGTKDGLNRYDGYSFKIFRYESGQPGCIGNNFIHSLYVDEKGILWVGTERGLYSYDPVMEGFKLLDGTGNDQISRMASDGKGNLWFISGFTLSRLHQPSGKLTYFTIEQYFEATSVATEPDGTLWASTPNGFLKRFNPASQNFSSFDVFKQSGSNVPRWIERIYCAGEGRIFVGTSYEGAKLFDAVKGTYKNIITHNEDKTALFVRNFMKISEQEYWIATESGIYIYNMKTSAVINLKKNQADNYSLSDNAVYTFTRDKEGGIWAGTYFGGVNYFPRQYTPFKKVIPYNGNNSISGNVVREIRQDHFGNLWIGTEDAGLNKIDNKTGVITQFKPTGKKGSISYSNIHGLLVHNNELWIGTFEHGIDVMNIVTGKVMRHYSTTTDTSLKSNFIYCVYQTASGQILIGTTIGAYSFDSSNKTFKQLPGMPLHVWYTSLLKDTRGVIWGTTFGNGVNYYDTRTQKSGNFRHDPLNKNSLGSDRVNCVFEDSDRNLWFATEGGLCRLDPVSNNFKRYTTHEGFPGNFIISILQDEKKNLWISTTKGLVCFDPATEHLTVYTRANGLLTDQFNFSSGFRDRDGRMYFGSSKGLISFEPREFVKDPFIPPIFITGFQVKNRDLLIDEKNSALKRSISFTDRLTLPYNESTFSIDFAALNYTAPETMAYAYRMEGLDKDWTILKTNRRAYFTGLAPGTYLFRVRASNSSGIWSPKEARLVVVVLPPWWTSWWAYAIYFVLTLAGIIYFIRIYHKRTEQKNRRKIELMEIAKEKEIFKAKIEFFTNVAHEIKTPLTLIKGPMEKVIRKAGDNPDIRSSLTIMERNTNRLIDLTNQLLDFRKTEIRGFSLNFIRVNISDLLEETYANFRPLAEQKNLLFELLLPPDAIYASVDLDALNKIFYNLFSNAVKYAKEKLFISMQMEGPGSFIIEWKNDGYLIPMEKKEKIFEPFFRLKETERQKGTGIGLALSRSLAELHKGRIELREPEYDLNVFRLTLPLHQENEPIISGEPAEEAIRVNVKEIL